MQRRRPPQLDRLLADIDAGAFAPAHATLLRLANQPEPHVDVLSALADVLVRMGRGVQAEHYARRVLAMDPSRSWGHHLVGQVLFAQRRLEEAEGFQRRAAELDPREAQHRMLLSSTIGLRVGPHAAAGVLRAARTECPEDAGVLVNLAHALHATGDVAEALPLMRRAVELQPRHVLIADGLCAMTNYAPGVSQREQADAHRHFGRLVRMGTGPVPHCPRWPLTDGRLRIGLLSPDLREHAVAYLIRALVEHADRAKVDIACYFVGPREDAMSAELKRHADVWRHVPHLSAPELAESIKRDRVHALIDLAGHTASHRLRAISHRPAPLQATYMGYPNTTGLDCVDLRITDAIADPPQTQEHNTERLAYLPPCFLSFPPPAWLPAPTPRADDRPVTFACFGSMLKMNHELFGLWADVLKAAPGSRLLLKNAGLREESVRSAVRRVFGAHGIEESRLRIEPPAASAREIIPLHAEVDIALDTVPYTGTTTLCESLAMGVPVISMTTDTPAGRVSRSILSAVGTPELVATDRNDYVRITAGLVIDQPRRAVLRATLRERFLASCIADGPGFAARFVELVVNEWNAGTARAE